MTLMRSEQLRHDQQEKGFSNFHENFDLNVTAQELEQQLDLQWELLDNCHSQYSELSGRMEKHNNLSMVAHQQGEQVPKTKKTSAGCADHLLILAQSAEIVSQSEDCVAWMHKNNQKNIDLHSNLVDQMSQEYASNINADDQKCSRELLDRLSTVSHVCSHQSGFGYEVTRTRLTQIRKQARCKNLIFDQERTEDSLCKLSQGKAIRLNQIKHQARCKSKKDLSQQMITGPKNEQPKGRILRLSQMKHQARSKGNSTVKGRTEEHMDESLPCNRFEDNNEKMIARQFMKKKICQGVRWDIENLKEHQRTARRLRAFKTKNRRQQLRTKFKRVNSSPIGLTSMTNSQRLSNSATLLKDNDLISCPQELPETSGSTEKLRANLGTEKLQGYHRSNESSALRCKSLQHTPVQNNLLPFTRLPDNIFQQCDTNMGWMLYMQLKEYHRVVARQHRAERIEEKRALKDKQTNTKNPSLAADSEAQKEFIPAKRLRLTQLRREARLGNHYSAVQGLAEN